MREQRQDKKLLKKNQYQIRNTKNMIGRYKYDMIGIKYKGEREREREETK